MLSPDRSPGSGTLEDGAEKRRLSVKSVQGRDDDVFRELNVAARAFNAILTQGPLARSALRRLLGASASTVTLAVQELFARGLVVETGADVSTGGRRAKLLDLAPGVGGVIAVDLGGAELRIEASHLSGQMLASARRNAPPGATPGDLRALADEALAGVRTAIAGPLRAIALAVPGIVDPATHGVSAIANVPGWGEAGLTESLADVGVPLLVENEANLAAIGEHWSDPDHVVRDMIFISLDTGIGAGIILNDALLTGSLGAAGEIGYFRQSGADTETLESKAGTHALVRRYLAHGGAELDATVQIVLALSESGDSAAAEAVAEIADHLAVSIANIILVLNPQKVVLGDRGLSVAAVLLAPIATRVAQMVPVMPPIEASRLGPSAGLVGATLWAARHASREIVADLSSPAGPDMPLRYAGLRGAS